MNLFDQVEKRFTDARSCRSQVEVCHEADRPDHSSPSHSSSLKQTYSSLENAGVYSHSPLGRALGSLLPEGSNALQDRDT
jgi:hypothetical protein